MKFFKLVFMACISMVALSCNEEGSKVTSAQNSIEYLDNYENFRSFQEVIEPFKGKVLYVDLWATWCGPCKRQFTYKEGLKSYIKDKDVELVYLSYDRPGQEDKWKSFIDQNNLTGFHAFAYPPIQNDIREKFARVSNGRKGILLPTYIIVDRAGNVVNKNAPRPSSGDQLYQEIAKYL